MCVRISAGIKTAGIKFTHMPKIRFFVRQGRLVAPIHVKLGSSDGHVGALGCAKFHLNRHRGWVGMRPQNIKKFHFLVKSRPYGATPLTDFEHFRGFYTPYYPTFVFRISYDSRITGYGVIAEKPRVRQLGRIFAYTL